MFLCQRVFRQGDETIRVNKKLSFIFGTKEIERRTFRDTEASWERADKRTFHQRFGDAPFDILGTLRFGAGGAGEGHDKQAACVFGINETVNHDDLREIWEAIRRYAVHNLQKTMREQNRFGDAGSLTWDIFSSRSSMSFRWIVRAWCIMA